jgi:hypothetical protein
MDVLGVPNMCPGWLHAAASDQVRASRSFSLLVNHSPSRKCDPLPNQAVLKKQEGDPIGSLDAQRGCWMAPSFTTLPLPRQDTG